MSSDITQVTDKSGRSLWLRPVKGYYFSPQFNQYAVENTVDFPMREDDVLLVTYPKTGVHWSWEILRILVTGEIENKDIVKENYMIEWNHPDQYESLPSPRVLNNHLPFHLQPTDLLKKKPKVVLFYRNFKDVAVSFYHHHCGIKEYEYEAGDFGAYLGRLLEGLMEGGNPFNFHKEWEEGMKNHPDLPVYCCAYEDMKEDPVSEMRKVCKFLGKNHDDSFLQEAAKTTSFDQMKKTFGPAKPVFYRKGQVGDWKNHFTVAQNEWFDGLIQTEMADTTKFKFRYTLN